jgi:hypothetical protein
MSRITQLIAEKVAEQIVKPIGVKIKEAEKEMGEYVRNIVLKEIPKEVVEFYAKHKAYTRELSTVYAKGVGISSYIIVHIETLPSNTGSYAKDLQLNKVDAAKVIKFNDHIKDLKEKKKNTYTEIYNLLLSLRTYKRVQAELPEIYPYLPNSNEGKQLMIIPSVVREKIACLISSDIEKKCIDDIKA